MTNETNESRPAMPMISKEEAATNIVVLCNSINKHLSEGHEIATTLIGPPENEDNKADNRAIEKSTGERCSIDILKAKLLCAFHSTGDLVTQLQRIANNF